ncbi:MAG TPA: 6-phosphogluconolactonase [Candidatus Limnocylindrales bacterium]|nr:6-phosphogluconolactonase [Candidatus Limnocylindrales bacterium]
MFAKIEELFKKKNVFSHKNQGITVAKVIEPASGLELAKEILYQIIDRKTVIYLSGGSVAELYKLLAKEEKILPGAVGLIDERYGDPLHSNSNQLLIKNTGLLRYLDILDIPFYSMLQGLPRVETAEIYDQKIRELNANFPKSVGILGIGPDGHISGIAPNRSDFKNPVFDAEQKTLLVSEFNDKTGKFKERVTTTFLGLEMLDLMIVIAFGSAKQNALDLMFEDGKEEDIPARFLRRPGVAEKTLLITDQNV